MCFFCVCVCICMQTCMCTLRVCCIRGDAALCLPQWSIWEAVREMNDCRYIDYCSLLLCYLLPLSFLSAPCSISPVPPALPHHLRFLSLLLFHLIPSPHLQPPHQILLLSIHVCLILSPFYRISDHVTILCGWVAFRKSRHNPLLKDSLPGAWILNWLYKAECCMDSYIY